MSDCGDLTWTLVHAEGHRNERRERRYHEDWEAMVSRHTREPWSVLLRSTAKTAELWAVTGKEGELEGAFIGEFLKKEDAARAAACVNACSDLADPEEDIEWLKSRIKELEEELEEYTNFEVPVHGAMLGIFNPPPGEGQSDPGSDPSPEGGGG